MTIINVDVKSQWDYFEYTVGEHFIPSMFNNDETGLTDCESRQLTDWEMSALEGVPFPHHWAIADNSSNEFGRCDITGLMGATVTLRLMFKCP